MGREGGRRKKKRKKGEGPEGGREKKREKEKMTVLWEGKLFLFFDEK